MADNENHRRGLSPYLSTAATLALSVGFAVGWGSFVMPGLSFLPSAGPMGTLLGIAIGTFAMVFFALNYHRLSQRFPGPGGSYTYAQKVFGEDHGFIVGWFVFLAYISILWANGTAIKLFVRFLFGGALQFGFSYTVAGFEVFCGEVMAAIAFIVSAGAICMYGKRLAVRLNLMLVLVMLVVASALFFGALGRHTGGLAAMAPAFSPSSGVPFAQILAVVAMMPWAFVGFEAITNSSAEFRFPVSRTCFILLAAVVLSAMLYLFLAFLPVLAFPEEYGSWAEYIAAFPGLQGHRAMPVFCAAENTFGKIGIAMVAAAMFAGMLTGLIGSLVSTSRLMYAMAEDRVLPAWFGRLDADGKPRNAMLFVTAVSALVPFVGRTVVGWPVDVASIGVAIAFGYTSAAAKKTCSERGSCRVVSGKVAGWTGLAMSVFFGALLLIPNYFSATTLRAESYIVLAVWSILGFLYYMRVYKLGRNKKIGKSVVVWLALFVTVIFTTLMWSRQSSMDTVRKIGGLFEEGSEAKATFDEEADEIDREFLGKAVIEMFLLLWTLFIVLRLFKIMSAREMRALAEKVKLQELNEAKSYFFSTVSHDIRTPLNAIIGFSQMLKEGFDSKAEHDQAVDSIMVSGKTLLNLINDVLDLSKLESGKMEITPEPTLCQKLLSEIAESFRFSVKNPNLEVRACVKDMPPLMLDPQRIRQIAFNLMGNAVKFTEKGFVEVRASFSRKAGAEKGTFCLEVEDTGCGISEEDQKRIAMPYVQVGARNSRHGGTGLGLSICRQLSAAMGGSLTVASELGKGSVFAVVIPDVKVGKLETVEPSEEAPAPRNAQARRILMVDDQKMNLLVLKSLLLRISGDFDLTQAENGRKALEILKAAKSDPFDMVLTDLWMPEMGGEELVRAIRAMPELKDIPVYAITADVESLKHYAEIGFTGLLLKPVTRDALIPLFGRG